VAEDINYLLLHSFLEEYEHTLMFSLMSDT